MALTHNNTVRVLPVAAIQFKGTVALNRQFALPPGIVSSLVSTGPLLMTEVGQPGVANPYR